MTNYLDMIEYATGPAQVKYATAVGSGLSQDQVARKFGVHSRNVSRSLAKLKASAAKHGYAPQNDQTRPVPVGQSLKGVSTLYDDEGNIKIQWVKSGESKGEDARAAMQDFFEIFVDNVKGKAKPIKPPKAKDDDLMTVYPLGDPHFGMRAWDKETGIENFDTDIAEQDLKAALSVLIKSAPDSHTGVLLNLGDLFHADNLKPLTPESGHLLDTDGRMSYTIDAAARAFRYAIELMLKKHNQVQLINVRGNHDPYSALFFNKLMDAFYENEPRVTVIPNECKLINVVWGKTFLSIHHTDRLNIKRWYEMITRDYAKLWGGSVHRYGHGGHTHHEESQEIGGMIFNIWPTLAAPDAWHSASGYGAGRAAFAVTYHKEFGEVQRSKCSLDLARSAAGR